VPSDWANRDGCEQLEGRARAVENVRRQGSGRPNGPEVNPRGQGPRGYGRAARRMPTFEARDAGGVTPRKYR